MSEVTFADSAPPTLATLAGRPVVSIGSFSKVLWGGLRTGWLRADRALALRLGRLKAAQDLGSGLLDQAAVVGALPRHDEILAARRRQAATRYEVLARGARRDAAGLAPRAPARRLVAVGRAAAAGRRRPRGRRDPARRGHRHRERVGAGGPVPRARAPVLSRGARRARGGRPPARGGMARGRVGTRPARRGPVTRFQHVARTRPLSRLPAGDSLTIQPPACAIVPAVDPPHGNRSRGAVPGSELERMAGHRRQHGTHGPCPGAARGLGAVGRAPRARAGPRGGRGPRHPARADRGVVAPLVRRRGRPRGAPAGARGGRRGRDRRALGAAPDRTRGAAHP